MDACLRRFTRTGHLSSMGAMARMGHFRSLVSTGQAAQRGRQQQRDYSRPTS